MACSAAYVHQPGRANTCNVFSESVSRVHYGCLLVQVVSLLWFCILIILHPALVSSVCVCVCVCVWVGGWVVGVHCVVVCLPEFLSFTFHFQTFYSQNYLNLHSLC